MATATRSIDATEIASTLRDKSDVEVVWATLAAIALADQQSLNGGLGNCIAAAKGSLVVLIERFVPMEVASQAMDELYGDNTPLTLIQGGRD